MIGELALALRAGDNIVAETLRLPVVVVVEGRKTPTSSRIWISSIVSSLSSIVVTTRVKQDCVRNMVTEMGAALDYIVIP